MKRKFITILSYFVLFFLNTNLFCDENENSLKIGLLAPLSGEYKSLGYSLMYSLQLALEEIDDKNVYIIPRDSGSNNKKTLNNSVKELKSLGVDVVIGPINNEDFEEVKKYNDLVFISPSNINPEFQGNIISVGISFESQMSALIKFIKKKQKKRTVILIPKNNYTDLIENKIKKLGLKGYKTFKYSPDPKVLTGKLKF